MEGGWGIMIIKGEIIYNWSSRELRIMKEKYGEYIM